MFKKIINIFFLISFFTFIFLITKYYFSEQNLISDYSDEPIKHPLIEEIFTGKKGSGYFRPSN